MHCSQLTSPVYPGYEEPLFYDISISIPVGVLTGLTGPNGHGKSTLLREIEKSLRSRKFPVQLLKQHLDDLIDQERHASEGQQRLSDILKILRTLPFNSVVLLDEPGNHLDEKSLSVLLNGLQKFSGSILMVTHDARLLHHCEQIYHLENGELTITRGNYEVYRAERDLSVQAAFAHQERLYKNRKKQKREMHRVLENQQKRTLRAEKWSSTQNIPKSFVNKQRGRAQQTIARLSREQKKKQMKLVDSLEAVESTMPGTGRNFLDMSFDAVSGIRFEVEDLNFKFNNKWLWRQPLNWVFDAGERVGIAGSNGSGKSTLLNALAGKLSPQNGMIYRSKGSISHIPQNIHFADKPELMLLDWIRDRCGFPSTWDYSVLHAAGFTAQNLAAPMNGLSGGEKLRATLLVALFQQPNALLLDEPTNHLDLSARESLIELLLNYRGTLVIISHDEEFLKSVECRVQLMSTLNGR